MEGFFAYELFTSLSGGDELGYLNYKIMYKYLKNTLQLNTTQQEVKRFLSSLNVEMGKLSYQDFLKFLAPFKKPICEKKFLKNSLKNRHECCETDYESRVNFALH